MKIGNLIDIRYQNPGHQKGHAKVRHEGDREEPPRLDSAKIRQDHVISERGNIYTAALLH